MPSKPPHPCPRCRTLTLGSGLCGPCLRKADRTRGSAIDRGYDQDWAVYSREWLRRFPYCGQRADGQFYPEHSRCVRLGMRTPAQVTDHIVRLRDGGPRLDAKNSQSLCRGCNAAKDYGFRV